MKYLITIFTLLSINFSYAQNINWSSISDDQKSLTYLNFGYDFGITTQLGYGYKLNSPKPIILTLDYSFPMGEKLMDDFKFRLGGQISIYEFNNFAFSAKAYGNFRRHQTSFVSMSSFGSELAGLFGYYNTSWHLAIELGFDKSILTYLKHDEIMRDNFSEISDGWFIPSGGHFFYGIQGSKTLGKSLEFSVRAGVTDAQFDEVNALLPYYAQLGLLYRFSYTKGS